MLECGDYCNVWGIPFKISRHLRPDQAIVINDGRELLLGEGGILADRLQYGEERGMYLGPLARLKRDNDEAAERAKRLVHHAYAEASARLRLVKYELQDHGTIEARFHRNMRST